MVNWLLFEDKNQQAIALAKRIADDIRHSFQTKQQVVVCVPGGNTPTAFLDALSHQHLDWKNISVILNDERWVPLNDTQSNEATLVANLKKNAARDVNIVGFYPHTQTPEKESLTSGLDKFNQQYQDLLRPDICVIGMGEDGHFASLFPAMSNLKHALDIKQRPALLAAKPEGKGQRVTLNLASLLCANKHYLLITGSNKKQVIKEACINKKNNYPITYLLNETDIDIYYAD